MITSPFWIHKGLADVDIAPNTDTGYSNDCSDHTEWTPTSATLSTYNNDQIQCEVDSTTGSMVLTSDLSTPLAVNDFPLLDFQLGTPQVLSTDTLSVYAKEAVGDTYYKVLDTMSDIASGYYYIDLTSNSNLVGKTVENFKFELTTSMDDMYFRLDTLRMGSPLFFNSIQSKAPKANPNIARQTILGRDGEIIQIMARKSREFVVRGRFWETSDGLTVSEFWEKLEEIESSQLATGEPCIWVDNVHLINGFVTFNCVEIPANQIQVRFNIIEETNP